MKWIRKILGIDILIENQKQTNKYLKEIISIQKYAINNEMKNHSDKRSI